MPQVVPSSSNRERSGIDALDSASEKRWAVWLGHRCQRRNRAQQRQGWPQNTERLVEEVFDIPIAL
jgi:hypothetical protein